MALTNSSDINELLPEKMRALVVTHDVDWPRNGPGLSHVLARRDRFDANVIRKATEEGFNPYYGIPIVTEIEEQLHIRSTFFFRPKYWHYPGKRLASTTTSFRLKQDEKAEH